MALCRLAATAPIRPLAWEPPYAVGVALEKRQKDKKKKDVIHTYTHITEYYSAIKKKILPFTAS